jgi:hypothetical protein
VRLDSIALLVLPLITPIPIYSNAFLHWLDTSNQHWTPPPGRQAYTEYTHTDTHRHSFGTDDTHSIHSPLPASTMARRIGAGQQRRRAQRGASTATTLLAAAAAVSAQRNTTGAGNTVNTPLASINATARGNTWAVVGAPQVSAQQLFRGQGNKVGNSIGHYARYTLLTRIYVSTRSTSSTRSRITLLKSTATLVSKQTLQDRWTAWSRQNLHGWRTECYLSLSGQALPCCTVCLPLGLSR